MKHRDTLKAPTEAEPPRPAGPADPLAARPRHDRGRPRNLVDRLALRGARVAWAAWGVALAVVGASAWLWPAVVLADDKEKAELVDARLEGYKASISLSENSTTLTWFFFVFLGILALAALFKNAKRTHLD